MGEHTPGSGHLIGLACRHFRPLDGATDEQAREFFDLMTATGDTAGCSVCLSTQKVVGPLTLVLASGDRAVDRSGT